jgi:hypothetical protein
MSVTNHDETLRDVNRFESVLFCLNWKRDINYVLEFSGSERESPNDEAQEFYGQAEACDCPGAAA